MSSLERQMTRTTEYGIVQSLRKVLWVACRYGMEEGASHTSLEGRKGNLVIYYVSNPDLTHTGAQLVAPPRPILSS